MLSLPKHLGIIMDGNRRWAKEHGLNVSEGHKAGYRALKALLPVIKSHKIQYLSIYAFSSENWSRAKNEVGGLMQLLKWAFKNELNDLVEEGIRIRILGSKEGVPKDILRILEKTEDATKNNLEGTLCVCFNYGGQQEILDAVKQIVPKNVEGKNITKEYFEQFLYAADIPPVDLIIRTSGEQRLSNFMLWRAAYSELIFVKKHWPDFTEKDLQECLEEYSARQRRFGA